MSKTVYLCGFMGCGKTTAGKVLAGKLECPYTDMDEYIEKKQGMKIPEIFAEKGEEYFRECETKAVTDLGKSGGVIACGGGAMLKKINADAASETGTVVYIDTPFETCYKRIEGDRNRPIVMANTKESLEELYNTRKTLYTAHSRFKADGSGTPEEIAEEIAEFLKKV